MANYKNIPREQFPRSNSKSEGMVSLDVKIDNNEMNYIRDIEYIQRDGISLHIQLILPDYDKNPPPLIIYVAGSAFHWQNIPQTIPRLCLLANRGFAIASVEYRGVETALFPKQILDVKAAIGFIRENCKKYNLNKNNIYLMGDSSGGYTVLMAALTEAAEKYSEQHYENFSSSVKGVIDLFAPVDFSKMNDELSSNNHILPDSPEGLLIGGKSVAEYPELVEPTIITNYISKDSKIPPILIFHGTNDETVPFGQSCILYDKLMECGKSSKFYAVENAHHGGREFWSVQTIDIIEKFIKNGIL